MISILQDPEMGWRGWTPGDISHKEEVVPRKNIFYIEKYVRDIKQGQKVVPDLVKSIIRHTRLVKEKLWRILINMHQFEYKIQEFRVCTF